MTGLRRSLNELRVRNTGIQTVNLGHKQVIIGEDNVHKVRTEYVEIRRIHS